LAAGEHVVVNGQSRLEAGSRVNVRPDNPSPSAAPEQQAEKK